MSIEESPISCDFVMSRAAASGVTTPSFCASRRGLRLMLFLRKLYWSRFARAIGVLVQPCTPSLQRSTFGASRRGRRRRTLASCVLPSYPLAIITLSSSAREPVHAASRTLSVASGVTGQSGTRLSSGRQHSAAGGARQCIVSHAWTPHCSRNGDVAGRFPLVQATRHSRNNLPSYMASLSCADGVQMVQTILTIFCCIASLSRNPGGIRGSCQELFYTGHRHIIMRMSQGCLNREKVLFPPDFVMSRAAASGVTMEPPQSDGLSLGVAVAEGKPGIRMLIALPIGFGVHRPDHWDAAGRTRATLECPCCLNVGIGSHSSSSSVPARSSHSSSSMSWDGPVNHSWVSFAW